MFYVQALLSKYPLQPQPTFTCSKSTMEKPEKYMKFAKLKNKKTTELR